MRYFIGMLLIIVFASPLYAKHIHTEKEYQTIWCKRNCGVTEYVLSDLARVDCLTKTHAIEFDFANKWAESIGQSLYYGLMTGKKPGVVLIIENPEKDCKYIQRLKKVADDKGIDFWLMYQSEL